ncbi:hypothetical protein [Streptomyces angustmyceticus]|uniref:hypothetical protein n=1 Tax=Streptomyces angustmyceticus TaxID=285578 RepID=UPI003D91E10B
MTNPTFDALAVPMAIALKDTRKVFNDVQVADFIGRGWLVDDIDTFIAEHYCGYVWVEAEAGLGKTALAAWLVHERGYPSHFARYAQGASVRVALRNVAAQLIRRYDLTDFAPGGMLPDWAYAPEGFDALLTEAAERARTEGHPLVIVMDGADEAEAAGGGLPWGLPPLLPEGAYIVGTYRTGSRPAYPESPSQVLRIDRKDDHNQADMREYLEHAVRREPVAARLTAAGLALSDAVELLAKRSGGVWVYLRYVLTGIRTGQQPVAGLGDLPPNLSGYYARQITRWQSEPDWDDAGRPLLATLVAAREPLPYRALARLSGAPGGASVRRWCDLALRPYLTADDGSPERRYELYHASARSFFGGATDAQEDGLKIMAARLAGDVAEAHRRIAEYYVSCFGGFVDGMSGRGAADRSGDGNDVPEDLRLLADDPSLASVDDGYPLRHLTHHMIQADWASGLRRLLAAETPTGDRQAHNVWFTAHGHAGPLDEYLDDVERARQRAAHRTDDALRRRQPATVFAEELRYELMAASVASYTDSVGPQLLEQLVARGVWTSAHGLSHARRLTDPGNRFSALVALQPYLPEEQRLQAAEEALEAVRSCDAVASYSLDGGDHYYSPALLIPYLPEGRREELTAQAVVLAVDCWHEDMRGQLLALAAVHAPPGMRAALASRAVDEIRADEDPWQSHEQVSALVSLLPLLPTHIREEALDEVRQTVRADDFEPGSERFWLALLPLLTGEERETAVAEATAAGRSIPYLHARAHYRAALLAVLPPVARRTLLAEALTDIRSCQDQTRQGRALSVLLPHLPPAERRTAVTDILADARLDQHTLARLAPHLPIEELRYHLRTTLHATSDYRVGKLAALVAQLPDRQQVAWAAETLSVARLADTPMSLATGLVTALPTLPDGQQAACIQEALAQLQLIDNDWKRGELLMLMLRYLTEPELRAAAEEWFSTPRKLLDADDTHLARIVAYLPDDALAGAVRYWADGANQYIDLWAVAPHLPTELVAEALRATPGQVEDYAASSLEALVPHLTGEPLSQALARARAFAEPQWRASVLAAAVPSLPPEQREAVAHEATAAAQECSWEPETARVLTELLPAFPEDSARKAQALAAARAISEEEERAKALSALVQLMPSEERPALASEALAIVSEVDRLERVRPLVQLAPHVPQDQLGSLLDVAPEYEAEHLATAVLTQSHERCGHSPQVFVQLMRQALPRTTQRQTLTAITDNLERLAAITDERIRTELARAVDDVLTWWP